MDNVIINFNNSSDLKTEIDALIQNLKKQRDDIVPTHCSICNLSFVDDDICRINLKCNHIFHQECIDVWYCNNYNCPICNQLIDINL